jgi:hypothetical protein
MNTALIRLLTFTEVRDRMRNHPLRVSEVPVEHAVSLPLPTKRWMEPCYAFFASPALRRPGQPVEQGAPDRWWAMSAHGGRIIIYALAKALPLADEANWETVTLPLMSLTIEELKQVLKHIEELLNELAPSFFAGEAGNTQTRKALAAALLDHLPQPLVPQYRALAPDFFAWLEGSLVESAASQEVSSLTEPVSAPS